MRLTGKIDMDVKVNRGSDALWEIYETDVYCRLQLRT